MPEDPVLVALERAGLTTLVAPTDADVRDVLYRLADEATVLNAVDRTLLHAEATTRLQALGVARADAFVQAALEVGRQAAVEGAATSDGNGSRNPRHAPVFDVVGTGLLDALLAKRRDPVDAVPTPLAEWNRACRDEGGGVGLARGWHIIVAGATGAGKSLLGLNLAAEALRHGEGVAFISLEMSQTQLVTRLLAIATGTSVRHLEAGAAFNEPVARTAATEFRDLCERTGGRLYVNRTPLHRLADIVAAFQREHERHGCRYFVTDYLQLCWAGSATSLFENITEISHTVRGLAVELGIVSVALSQFNRETSANRLEAPRPQGLMGGSPLENDADQVVLLDHSQYDRTAVTARTKVLVSKNRHGPQLELPVAWDFSTLRIQEVAP